MTVGCQGKEWFRIWSGSHSELILCILFVCMRNNNKYTTLEGRTDDRNELNNTFVIYG